MISSQLEACNLREIVYKYLGPDPWTLLNCNSVCIWCNYMTPRSLTCSTSRTSAPQTVMLNRRSEAFGGLYPAISTWFLMDWAGVELSSSTTLMTQSTRYILTFEPSDQHYRSEPSIHIFVSHQRTRAPWSLDVAQWWRLRLSRMRRGSVSGWTPESHRRWLVQSSMWPLCTTRIDCVPLNITLSTDWPVLRYRSRVEVDRMECDGRPCQIICSYAARSRSLNRNVRYEMGRSAKIKRIESRLLKNRSDGSGLLSCRKRAAAHWCVVKCINEFACKPLDDPRWNWV